MTVQITPCICLKCGHQWIPRIADVRMCPSCRSIRWDREPATPKSEIARMINEAQNKLMNNQRTGT